jgi:hypothetical protein
MTMRSALLASVAPEVKITGAELLHRVDKSTPTERALLAHDLASGRIEVAHFTTHQAKVLARCSQAYQYQVSRLSDHERHRLRCRRTTLGELHAKVCDGAVLRLVKRIGPDRVMRALDIVTAPQAVAAE